MRSPLVILFSVPCIQSELQKLNSVHTSPLLTDWVVCALAVLPQGGCVLLLRLSARHLATSDCLFAIDVRSGHQIRFERIRKQNYKALFYVEYKARERIHRSVADLRLLAIPASWSRVADSNPN